MIKIILIEGGEMDGQVEGIDQMNKSIFMIFAILPRFCQWKVDKWTVVLDSKLMDPINNQ